MKFDEFIKHTKTFLTAINALGIGEEATKNISEKTRKRYPQIGWRKISEITDKVIQEYFIMRLKRVRGVIKKDIPHQKPLFDKILKDQMEWI